MGARSLLLLPVCICMCVCGRRRGRCSKGFTEVLIFELSLEGVSQMAKDHRSYSYSLYICATALKDTQ